MAHGPGQQRHRGGPPHGQHARGPDRTPPPPPFTLFASGAGGALQSDLFTEQASRWANFIPAGDRRGQLNSHQLRRFFGEFKSIEQKVKQDPANFAKYLPLVGLLKARAAYASNPDNERIPSQFRQFIDMLVDLSKDRDSFLAVCQAFEAVVGYLYGKGMK